MLIFGHTGITLGVALFLTRVLTHSRFPEAKEGEAIQPHRYHSQTAPELRHSQGDEASQVTTLANRIDLRLLLIGSLLPDIIDKPVGQFFFRDNFSNGRIFSHTLLFLIVITTAGLYFYHARTQIWLLVLSFGTFTHLIFDQMWLEPRSLLWPVYGLAFEKIDLTHWTQDIFYALRTDPGVYVPEVIGAVILAAFVAMLVSRRQVYLFIRRGQAL